MPNPITKNVATARSNKPTNPEIATSTGSESLKRHKRPKLTSAIAAVGTSTIARAPKTRTAPVIAPVAAAVAPSTKALSCGLSRWRLNQGAGIIGKKIHRQENADGCHNRAGETGNNKTDECDCNDHRTGRDHGDGDRVQELVVGKPAELLDYALLQKWNDRESTAKHKGAGFRKKYQDLSEYILGIVPRFRFVEPRLQTTRSPSPTRRRPSPISNPDFHPGHARTSKTTKPARIKNSASSA